MPRSLILALAALAGCTARPVAPPLDLSGLAPEIDTDDPEQGVVQVAFTDPGTEPDGGQDTEVDDLLIGLIDATSTELLLAFYDFDDPGIIAAVERAADRGVAVEMVGDADELDDEGYVAMEALGLPLSLRPAGNRIMHNKFVVADGQAVWTGSTNATETGLWRNDNNALLVISEALAAVYADEHAQMAAGSFGRGKTALAGPHLLDTSNGALAWHMSPADDPVQAVVAAIDDAHSSVTGMVFSFTHDDVRDALLRAQARGVEVLVIFDESQANGSWSEDETLAAAGVPVLIDGNHNSSGFSGGKLHHKALVIDAGLGGARVVTGSMNWSAAGTDENDENTLIIDNPDVAEAYAAEACRVKRLATRHPDLDPAVALPDPCTLPAATLVLNELYVNPRAQRAFVEISNPMEGPVDLVDWTLRLADGTALALETLLPPDHAGWLAAGDGVALEADLLASRGTGPLAVGLWDPEGYPVDTATALPSPRLSQNRREDGVAGAPFGPAQPTPGTRRDGRPFVAPPLHRVLINELLADPEGDDTDAEFVELVNVGTEPAPLAGWELWDGRDLRHRFGDESLAPGAALVIWSGGTAGTVASTGALSLNNSGDELVLVDAEGETVDAWSWSSSRSGVSWTRAEDGEPEAAVVLHDSVSGLDSSPGLRADGSAW